MATPRALVGMFVCTAACSFTPSGAGGGDGDPDAGSSDRADADVAAPDARRVDAPPGQPDAPPAPATCSAPITSGLVTCVEFEDDLGDGTLTDLGPNQLVVASTGLSPTPRGGTSTSAVVGANASTFVGQTQAIELASGFTLASWVRVDGTLATGGHGVIDHDLQYAMFVEKETGVDQLSCYVSDAEALYGTNLPLGPAGSWHFAACTWRAPAGQTVGLLCTYLFGATTNVRCGTVDTSGLTAGRKGIALGHDNANGVVTTRLPGAMDNVWIYNRPLAEDDVCRLAGRPANCVP